MSNAVGRNCPIARASIWCRVGTPNITSKRVERRTPTRHGQARARDKRGRSGPRAAPVGCHAGGGGARGRTWIDRQAWILAASGTPDESSFSSLSRFANTEDLGPSAERHSLQTFSTFPTSTTSSSIVDHVKFRRESDPPRVRPPSPTPTPRTPLPTTRRLGTQRFVCG